VFLLLYPNCGGQLRLFKMGDTATMSRKKTGATLGLMRLNFLSVKQTGALPCTFSAGAAASYLIFHQSHKMSPRPQG
jgi:hypothetical protein